MQCVDYLFGICLIPAAGTTSLFGFKDFIAALALLVIIYTISDIRYRFRIAVAPTPLLTITYGLIGVIGFGTLLTDVWISEKWLVPSTPFMTTAIWQGILGVLFLGLVITWMHYAFIKPPIFGRNNYQKYAQELYRIVLKGSESELPVIAHELAASAQSLVAFARCLSEQKDRPAGKPQSSAEGYANDMLLLIANRKFCRHVVASSPITAIRFLDEVAEAKAYRVPIGLFAQNISTEAIRNKDSGLYHEDEGYHSGLLGYVKPFSQAIYGNYELVEALQDHSPLDIHYKAVWTWDADQFETYCRSVQLTLKSYLQGGHWRQRSAVLSGAIREIHEVAGRAIWDIDKADEQSDDAQNRLRAGVSFVRDSINAIGELKPPPKVRMLRVRKGQKNRLGNEDLYDQLAEAMFEIIHSAAYVTGPPGKAWSIHHNSVWTEFFSFGHDEQAWKIVRFKVRRLLYNEIRDLESWPNYKAARVLGICLNVMGLAVKKRSSHDRGYDALKVAVLAFTRRNYLRLRAANTEIADACLIGGITFDAEHLRLVKTYAKGLKPEPDRDYLPLLGPAAKATEVR